MLAEILPGEVLAITVLTVLGLRTMVHWLGSIASPTTWDYGPAQLAVHVAMFADGAPLYRDFRTPPFNPLVYGPIVPIMTAKLAAMFGSGPMAELEAGRLLTIASTIITCAMIFVLARKAGTGTSAAIVASLSFVLSPIVLRWGFEYRVDMPAIACELAGIAAFTAGCSAAAVALFVIGFFIKQGSVVGIATVVLFCWMSGQQRRAISAGIVWLAAIAAGTALLSIVYPSYLLNTFGAVRTTGLDFKAPPMFLGILIGSDLGIAIFVVLAFTRRRISDPLIVCLLIVASIHDVASCLRWGSNAYYFLPALAALAIVASAGVDLAFERMHAMSPITQLASGAAMATLLASGLILAPRSITMPRAIGDAWDPRALEKLHAIDGPIMTDAAELNLVDAQPNLQWIDLMVLTSMQQVGTFDDRALLDEVQRHRIAAFALDADGLDRAFRGRPLFWPGLRGAIETNYEPLPSVGPPLILIPKTSR